MNYGIPYGLKIEALDEEAKAWKILEKLLRDAIKQESSKSRPPSEKRLKSLAKGMALLGKNQEINARKNRKMSDLAERAKGMLVPVEGAQDLPIKELSGKRIIAYDYAENAQNIFESSSEFFRKKEEKGALKSLVKTKKTEVSVWAWGKSRKSGLKEAFKWFGVPLGQLALTQDQIIEFIHLYHKKMTANGCQNYFLIKEGREFFVLMFYISNYKRWWVKMMPLNNVPGDTGDALERIVVRSEKKKHP